MIVLKSSRLRSECFSVYGIIRRSPPEASESEQSSQRLSYAGQRAATARAMRESQLVL